MTENILDMVLVSAITLMSEVEKTLFVKWKIFKTLKMFYQN